MRQHHMPDPRPARAGFLQNSPDRVGAPVDAGVDHSRLSTPDEHVGRNETEIDTGPDQLVGGRRGFTAAVIPGRR